MTQSVAVGDRIIVDSQKVGEAARQGEILEITERDYGTSLRVRWQDGHESTIRPTAGTFHAVKGGTSATG